MTISPADGKLLVLTPGMGAVSTTFFAGLEMIRRGLTKPFGSLTQMQWLRRNSSDPRGVLIKDFVPLASLDDIVVAGWDPCPDDAYTAAQRAGVLTREDLEAVADFLRGIQPMPAVFDRAYVQRLQGTHTKSYSHRRDALQALRDDIRQARERSGASRAVMVWCGSTESYREPAACHGSPAAFDRAVRDNDPTVAPSQLYAYAALLEGVPFVNGAPNLTVDLPAMERLANERGVAIAGKDFKTGQTLLKTVLGSAFKARMLGVEGWFSTNILGNRDGEVLDAPENFQTKEAAKTGALDTILDPDLYPDLYQDFYHKVRINYYPPRGDAKESWDSIDVSGWLGYGMQIKVNFLCRDSILAAPLVLDTALLIDLAQRAGRGGIQDWLSFYFKCPQVRPGHALENDLFVQHLNLQNALRDMGGDKYG